MLNVYIFNGTEAIDGMNEWHGAAIIAESMEEADRIYKTKGHGGKPHYEIEKIPLKRGLMLSAYGHDDIGMGARLTNIGLKSTTVVDTG